MYLSRLFQRVSLCSSALVMFAGFHVSAAGQSVPAVRTAAVAVNRVMSLDPLTVEETAARSLVESAKPVQKTPENFRQFEAVSKGQIGDTKTLTLRFTAGAKLLTIKSTPDFKVEQGGSCIEGSTFVANSTCTLLVRSTPQGAGSRLGKLEITNSTDATPLLVGLGGFGYAPTISFTPSLITTVPGTFVSNAGVFSGGTNLAIDGGDILYIADTGHNVVDAIDSTGTITNITKTFGATAPIGVAVDHSGDVYFDSATDPFLTIVTSPFSETNYSSSSSTSCAFGATCSPGDAVYAPSLGALAIDTNGNIFMNSKGEAFQIVNSSDTLSMQEIPLLTPDNYNNSYLNLPLPLAVDSSDTLYGFYNYGSSAYCIMTGEQYYYAETDIYKPVPVAGTQTGCGFSGDGGQARGAKIGGQIGQMTFDIAGNLYFTDTLNQRVRQIDNATGIITTIAGNGAIGYGGDNTPATAATLSNPTGVTVDSQGQVYILSQTAASATSQVVRKVGVVGALNLGNLTVGTPSTAQTITLSNTGNSELDFTHVGFSSGNTTDFAIDPNTTSCNFTVALSYGRSCLIGFIFTPSAAGNRSAVLSITSDTLAGINTIQLSGAGYTTATLTPASLSYASTGVGSSTAAQVATLTNTGKAAMTISGIAFSGTGASSYSDTTTCGTTLAVATSCTISVTFKPTAVGSLPATLTVTDNAITGHQIVALTGTGSGVAKAVLSPTSLTFASTKVGATSATQTVTLSNPGTATLTLTSITMTGTNATDFPLTKTCGTSLAVGGSCSISVSFKPSATGTRTATVSVVTSIGTVTAGTTGTAVAASVVKPTVTLVPPAITMSTGSLVLSAHVASETAKIPTGDVHLMDGDKMIKSGVLSNGAVGFDLSGLSQGLHMLQAVYMGDKWNSSAESAKLARWVSYSPGPQPLEGSAPISQPTKAE